MNKILIVVAMALFVANPRSYAVELTKIAYYENNQALGGSAIIQSSSILTDGVNTSKTFELDIPLGGAYHLTFWSLHPQLPNGEYCAYDVKVNGVLLSSKLVSDKPGWHYSLLQGDEAVSFSRGKNTVTIIGEAPNVPAVEHVSLSVSKSELIGKLTKYDNFISNINGVVDSQNSVSATSIPAIDEDLIIKPGIEVVEESYVPFDYYKNLNFPFKYTYHGLLYFKEGQTISIKSESINGQSHKINLYSVDQPSAYSWWKNSDSDIEAVAPVSGFYGIMARSASKGVDGLCNITINDTYRFENLPITLSRIIVGINNDQPYNTFTVDSSVDPIIWLEESVSGKVIAYSDDYMGTGDFDWKNESRIRTQLPRMAKSIVVAAANSYAPEGVSNLYAKAKSTTFSSSTFPLLKEDDCIQSAPSGNYNCIGWSGGLVEIRWPDYEGVDDNYLDWYDEFYGTERYPNSPIYTRNGATEENSLIDLWGYLVNPTWPVYTHASIRKGANEYPHGYDWESKAGLNKRIFHPRYAIANAYGEVLHHYRIAELARKVYSTEVEAVAADSALVETVKFNDLEIAKINDKISKISSTVIEQFEALYSNWKQVFESSVQSNPNIIADCDEYRALLSFIVNNSLNYAVYEKLDRDESCAMKLVVDIDYGANESIVQDVKDYIKNNKCTDDGIAIIRPSMTFVKMFVKQKISEDSGANNIDGIWTQDLCFSNTDDVEVKTSVGDIMTRITIDTPSLVSADLVDRDGNALRTIIGHSEVDAGTYEFGINGISPGIYFVKVLVDGRLNVKKVLVK